MTQKQSGKDLVQRKMQHCGLVRKLSNTTRVERMHSTDVDGRAWVLGLNEIETNSAKNALSVFIQAINDTIQLS